MECCFQKDAMDSKMAIPTSLSINIMEFRFWKTKIGVYVSESSVD